jgi:lathosterol oxidase
MSNRVDLSGVGGWAFVGWSTLLFAVLYFGFAGIHLAITRWLLPALGVGRVLDARPLKQGQVAREIGWSLVSVVIFGTGLVVPWWMIRQGWIVVLVDVPWWKVGLELSVLVLWNDVHFYVNHRLLHHKWLFPRFHLQHHRSIVVTPFTTYAFHPVEASMLTNMLIWPVMVHDFSWQALVAMPVISLWFNNVGHSNYDGFPCVAGSSVLTSARRHHLHHAKYHGNYGFLFSFMDRLFGTTIPDEASEARPGQDRTPAEVA